ncbi:MAG: hypothetical protein AB8B99_16475 [Phormidesmis sp.]
MPHHLELFKYQLQQCLTEIAPQQFEVWLDSETTLFVCNKGGTALDILWVIDAPVTLAEETTGEAFLERARMRSLPCAQQAIADYWLLAPTRVELRTYATPSHKGYLQQKLYHIGAIVSPTTLPSIQVRMREPAPLHLFTRNLSGQHIHPTRSPLLQVGLLSYPKPH